MLSINKQDFTGLFSWLSLCEWKGMKGVQLKDELEKTEHPEWCLNTVYHFMCDSQNMKLFKSHWFMMGRRIWQLIKEGVTLLKCIQISWKSFRSFSWFHMRCWGSCLLYSNIVQYKFDLHQMSLLNCCRHARICFEADSLLPTNKFKSNVPESAVFKDWRFHPQQQDLNI